jgi:hypothetical protein
VKRGDDVSGELARDLRFGFLDREGRRALVLDSAAQSLLRRSISTILAGVCGLRFHGVLEFVKTGGRR